jgi:DNA-binding NarL/FixJ family response regulator
MTIKILLADDQALFREGLRMVLSTQADLEVVGEATNGVEALQLAATLHPDIILMDMRMPVLGGVEAPRRLRETQPDCRVIVALNTVKRHVSNMQHLLVGHSGDPGCASGDRLALQRQ